MRASDLVIYSVVLYALRLPPAVLFLIQYRGQVRDPMAGIFRVIMGTLILTASSRIVYIWDARLMAQIHDLTVPLSLALIDLFGSVAWCWLAWALYLLFTEYKKEA